MGSDYKPTGNPVGKPSEFTQERADLICKHIAEGKSIRWICDNVEGAPSDTTVYNWLFRFPQFVEQYAIAREAQSEFYAQHMVDLADSCGLSHEEINKARLQIDTRKWISAKLKPKKYGDRVVQEHTGTIEHKSTADALTDRMKKFGLTIDHQPEMKKLPVIEVSGEETDD